MTDGKERDEQAERQDDPTDKRTLAEIEAEEDVSSDSSDSPVPSPDEGGDRSSEDDSGELV